MSKPADVCKDWPSVSFPLPSLGLGVCEGVKQEAMKFMEEAEQLIRASNTSHFPFGESFLMAKGIQLTDSDLLRSAQLYEPEVMVSEKLLSGSDYAFQLAARSGKWKGDDFN